MPGGASQTRNELDGWQDWAKSRGARGLAYVLIGADGESRARSPRTSPIRNGPGLPPLSALSLATACSSPRALTCLPGAPRSGPAGDRPPGRADRRLRLGVPLGGRRADVRGDRQRRLDRGAPPVHRAHPGVGRQLRHGPGRRARPTPTTSSQRLRDRRRLDPYPPAGDAAGRLRRHRADPGGGQVAVRLPARRVQLRPAAARRHRLRLGPHRSCCSPARTRSAT